MTLMFSEPPILTLQELQVFLDGTTSFTFSVPTRRDRAAWVRRTLERLTYCARTKPERGLVRRYLQKVAGLSRAQVARHVHAFVRDLPLFAPVARHGFPRTYTDGDITRLAETDTLHGRLNGAATVAILARMHQHGDADYVRLANLSTAHLYNFRKSAGYRRQAVTVLHTRSTQVGIGTRRAPEPQGRPGFLRVDSVHQGDQDGVKGVYYVHLVDEVTQWDLRVAVEGISEAFLLPALEAALARFPFVILGFHSDNGSEYINRTVAKLLETLRIAQTKSRPRHSSDNGLVESKNASTIRRYLGHGHIPGSFAARLNVFFRDFLDPYVNEHRPSAFPVITTLANGKRLVTYPAASYQTPLEKLCSLSTAQASLRPGVTLEGLRAHADTISPNEAARRMQAARRRVLLTIQSSAILQSSAALSGSFPD